MPQNEVATTPRPGAAHSIADIEKLADAVARSRMFGITTKEQALVLMAISQAEGRHPAEAARDYNIIQGKPAKTSEAMMRDFIHAGGRVEWHALTDDIADATFSHPAGGTIRIIWDAARAAKAGLASKDMWRKFPRQMMRSRCVSEGVRTVCPMATSGFYVPEEVRDMPAILPAASASDAAGDLDEFAAAAEPYTARDILAEAREVAAGGTVLFREFWAGLSPSERDGIRQHLDEFKTDAEVADKFAAKHDDPFGLPPSLEHLMPAEPPPPVEPKPAGGSFPSSQQGAPDPAPAPTAARAAPDRGASPAPRRIPRQQPAPEPPVGAAEDDPFGLPPTAARLDLEIAMPLKGGKPDPRTWALALFAPKVRRCTASNELADLLGANEQNLEEARATLAPADRAEMERIIDEQWQKLPG